MPTDETTGRALRVLAQALTTPCEYARIVLDDGRVLTLTGMEYRHRPGGGGHGEHQWRALPFAWAWRPTMAAAMRAQAEFQGLNALAYLPPITAAQAERVRAGGAA